MIATLIAILCLGGAPRIPTPDLVSRAFHDQLTREFGIQAIADADVVYQGYVDTRHRISEVYETRGSLIDCQPGHFQARMPETDKAILDAFINDQRQCIMYLQEADHRYFRTMIDLASVGEERAPAVMSEVRTRWRMQWLFDAYDLPPDHLSGFINLERLAGNDASAALPHAAVSQYRQALAPLLEQLEHTVLFDRYESGDLMGAVYREGAANNTIGFEKALDRLVKRNFQGNALADEIRAINIRLLPEFERSLGIAERARLCAAFFTVTFPYVPDLAAVSHAAFEACGRASAPADLEAVAQLFEQWQRTVMPLVMEADKLYPATHASTARRLKYLESIRKNYGLESDGSSLKSIEIAKVELEKKKTRVAEICSVSRKRFEELFR
jgi:hypothetical protein